MITFGPDLKIEINPGERQFLLERFRLKGYDMSGNGVEWDSIFYKIQDYNESLLKESKIKLSGTDREIYYPRSKGKYLGDIFKRNLTATKKHYGRFLDCIYVFLFDKSRTEFLKLNPNIVSENNISFTLAYNGNESTITCDECQALNNSEFSEINEELKKLIKLLSAGNNWSEFYFYAQSQIDKINKAFEIKSFLISEFEYPKFITHFFKCVEQYIIGTSVPDYLITWTDQCAYGEDLLGYNKTLIDNGGGIIRFFISSSVNDTLDEYEINVLNEQRNNGIELYVTFEKELLKIGIKAQDFDFSIFDGISINETVFMKGEADEPLKYSKFDANVNNVLPFFENNIKPLVLKDRNLVPLFKFENNALISMEIKERKELLDRLFEMIKSKKFISQ
jgi:hypothetical protein